LFVQSNAGHVVTILLLIKSRSFQESDEFFIKNAFAYIDQLDKHAPRLTVEETFDFAYQCSTGGKFIRQEVPDEIKSIVEKADHENLATRLVLAGLGLTEVKDTYVGDTDIRGVSGGQRRRVTVGEVCHPKCYI
jgi:ABC-type multidrug transport system ATPase subunit